MALPDTGKFVLGTPLVFANTAEYSPTDASQPATIDADIDLGALAAAGGRQSVKLDLGSANLDMLYNMRAYIEWHSAPTSGGTVDFYLGWSNSATAGEDNPGNLAGTDSAYTGYTGLAEGLKHLDYQGSLTASADADLQVDDLLPFTPKGRWCMLVVVNNSDVSLANTDAIETGIAVTPVQHQIQD